MLDFIVSHLAEFITLLLAIIAVAGLLLNYLFRPTKIEVEKRHSDDLKKLVERWKSEVESCSLKNPFDIKSDEKYSLETSVEKEYYFDDIKNHLPSDLDLLNDWEKFQKSWYCYEKKRHDFFRTVEEDVTEKIGLQWLPNPIDWAKNPGFSTRIIENIYADLSRIMEGWESHWLNQSYEMREEENKYILWCYNGGLLWSEKRDITEKAKESYLEILKNLKKSPYIELGKELTKYKKNLCEERESLERNLNYFAFIPLLPGKCKYIKWSLPGIIANLKDKLRIGRKR